MSKEISIYAYKQNCIHVLRKTSVSQNILLWILHYENEIHKTKISFSLFSLSIMKQ